jgi:5-methylcytosine-specific restriction protein A
MPARPKTICRKVACGRLIDVPGYCDKHAQLATGWNRSHSERSSTERGYGYAWQQLRKRILGRAGGLCQIKGSGCRFVAREVDHKVNKAKARELGWTDAEIDDESNLQACCEPCHRAKTHTEAAEGAGRGGGGRDL